MKHGDRISFRDWLGGRCHPSLKAEWVSEELWSPTAASPMQGHPWSVLLVSRGSWAGANALSRSEPAPKAGSAALACCPRQFLCPIWLAGVYKALSDYKDVLRWVVSVGYVHKVLKLVLKASQWHSCLCHWKRGASWICFRKKKYIFILEENHKKCSIY